MLAVQIARARPFPRREAVTSRRAVPLQNRVSPFGELCAFSARGLFMGNRGGRFHTDAKKVTARRWASRQWICCVLEFKGRRRDVWGRSYTELFFLDEPTAFAAGHRPCFECRRRDAEAFAEKWREARRLRRPPEMTTCCTPNAYEDMPNACTGATSMTARWRICRIRWGGVRRSRRHTPVLDARRLPCSEAAAAPSRCRCAHPAGDPRSPGSWL